ncbi:MAG: S-layer homology domain-containing protein [Oscillospiraceae bacterium]|nr:S-layer homology domain-containing protein [Oscillospiraceae bacterium]
MNKKAKFLIIPFVFCLLLAAIPNATAQGSAPIAKNLEITTYRGVSIGGALSATDPDGECVVFEITTAPVKGTIELNDDGTFVYTPKEGKRGKDYFGYRAIDESGNKSQEATVLISIEKQKTKVTYSDMNGNGAHFAAIALSECGIYTGAQIAGHYVFSPDTPVTRSEFLAMCMLLSGEETLSGISSTSFKDDTNIDEWAKPYVSTAVMCGIVSGYVTSEDGAVFRPADAISMSEAVVMLDNVLDLTDCFYVESNTSPSWYDQAAANLASCSILPYGTDVSSGVLTRADAAQMLISAMNVLNNR